MWSTTHASLLVSFSMEIDGRHGHGNKSRASITETAASLILCDHVNGE